jgi:hypothetical protein
MSLSRVKVIDTKRVTELENQMTTMTGKGAWKGWDGKTLVEMTDGSKWKQAEYFYEYYYAYCPQATVANAGLMLVDGMSRAVTVRRVYGRD